MDAVTNNYSVDYLKRAAFNDELQNVLRLLDITYQDEAVCAVIAYLEYRIKEIDKLYKK